MMPKSGDTQQLAYKHPICLPTYLVYHRSTSINLAYCLSNCTTLVA
jgi:hypothetical protein